MRKVLATRLIWVVVFLVVVSACGEATGTVDAEVAEVAEEAESSTDIGALPEELQGLLTSTTGEQVDLASLRGEDVVLWFWAPW